MLLLLLVTIAMVMTDHTTRGHRFSVDTTCVDGVLTPDLCSLTFKARSKLQCSVQCEESAECLYFRWDSNQRTCSLCQSVEDAGCSNAAVVASGIIGYRKRTEQETVTSEHATEAVITEQATQAVTTEQATQAVTNEEATVTTEEATEAVTTEQATEADTTEQATEAVTTEQATEAVTTEQATEAVTTEQTTEAFTTEQATTTTEQATEVVTTEQATEAVTTEQATEAVTTEQATEAVTTEQATEAVTTEQEATGVVTTEQATEAVTTEEATEAVTAEQTTVTTEQATVTTEQATEAVTTEQATVTTEQATVSTEQATTFPTYPMCENGGTWNINHCNCPDGFTDTWCHRRIYDCKEAADLEYASGARSIQLYETTEELEVYCYSDGGMEVLFREWQLETLSFNRSWQEYRDGFGDIDSDQWMGLETLHRVTNAGRSYQLCVFIKLVNDNSSYGHCYPGFQVGDEASFYTLHFNSIVPQNPPLGDSLSAALGQPFSTYDEDHDGDVTVNCALRHQSGWWFPSTCNATEGNPLGRIVPGATLRSGDPGEAFWLNDLGDHAPQTVSMALFV